jgi:glutamate dehydrogenase
MEEETGASVDEIANAYTITKGVFELDSLWRDVEALDNKIDATVQLEMLNGMRRSLRRAARWMLRHVDKKLSIQQNIDLYKETFRDLHKNLQHYLDETEYRMLEDNIQGFVKKGVQADIAYRITTLSTMFSSLDLAQIAATESRDISLVATLYFKLGMKLQLHWFLEQVNNQPVNNHWQALARASYREELDWQQRSLTAVLMRADKKSKNADKILENWMNEHTVLLERWEHLMTEFKTSKTHEFAKFSVALRELMLLSIKCA